VHDEAKDSTECRPVCPEGEASLHENEAIS